jgi:hypothetical protein
MFARLTSFERFANQLEALGAQQGLELVQEERDGARVLRFDDGTRSTALRTHFVVRGDHLLVLEGGELAEVVARLPPADSLARLPAYEQARAALGDTGHVFGYLDLRGMLAQQLGGPFGPPPALQAALDAIGFAGIAYALEAQDDHLGVKVALPARAQGPDALLRPARGSATIVRALDERPLALLSLHLDVDALTTRVAQALGPDGLNEALAITQAIGIDVASELLPLWTGEVGFAVSGPSAALYDDAAPAEGEALEAFDVHLTLGVRDADAAARILERALASPAFASVIEHRPGGGVAVPIPGWKELLLDVRQDAFVATTDEDVIQRLGDASSRSFAASVAPASQRALLEAEGAAALASIAIEALAVLVLSNPIDPGVLELGPPDAGLDSDAYRAAVGELEHNDTALEEAVTAAQRAQRALAQVFVDYGVLTLALRTEEDGAVAEGGQYFADGESLASLLVRHLAVSSELTRLERAAFELSARRFQLLHRLESLRDEADD